MAHSPSFLSPVNSDDDAVDADLLVLPSPPFKISYSTDPDVAAALAVPEDAYDKMKSGWEKHIKLLNERDTLRYENLGLKQTVTGLRNEVRRAKQNFTSLEEEYCQLTSDIVSARRDAHVYLVELYKVTGSIMVFKDDAANRRALSDAQEWLHREAARLVKAEMKAQGTTDYTTFHALVHLPGSLPATPDDNVTTS